jgi:hypothetical protein
LEIRETQIEDILVNAPVLTKNILKLDDEPRLIGRQMILPSGRLDMLYAYKTEFLLIELKIVPFQRRFVQQVLDYKRDLMDFQNLGRLLKGNIQPYLLFPSVTERHKVLAANDGVTTIEYNPESILEYFYKELRPVASFVETKPINIGIWNIHLINKFIYELQEVDSIRDLQNIIEGATKTLYTKIKFAHELRLIDWKPNSDSINLSDFGKKYVLAKDVNFQERLSEAQAELLKNFVIQNPYESSVILGIASMVESVFALSKNTYPVPISQLQEYFTYHSGKVFDWQTDKAKSHATKMYSNYAIDLGLLAKTDKAVYLTPEGFKFTIQMQLHKSLKLMNSLVIN